MRYLFLTSIFFASMAWSDIDFQRKKIKLGQQTIEIEVAQTQGQQAQGLMYRKEIKATEGMLFIYPTERIMTFWMKNTFIPLSIGFFDKNKKLVQIMDMEPVQSEMQVNPPIYKSRAPAQYALEVSQGWFKKHNVRPGVTFEFLPDKSPGG